MQTEKLDLLIRAERMVCPATGIDGAGVIGVRDGVIAFVDSGFSSGDLASVDAEKTC